MMVQAMRADTSFCVSTCALAEHATATITNPTTAPERNHMTHPPLATFARNEPVWLLDRVHDSFCRIKIIRGKAQGRERWHSISSDGAPAWAAPRRSRPLREYSPRVACAHKDRKSTRLN